MAKDRQKVIQSAEKLAARGRIQAAIDEYRKVLDRHPNDTSTLNRVGDLYVRLNRMPKAIELFQKTAESFGRQGFFVKAIAIYKKIIRLDPGQIRAYEALADLYNRQGLTGDSLAQYQVVADYYVKHEDSEAALNVYYSMVEIEPHNPSRRLQLAGLLQKDEKPGKALEQYSEISKLMLEHSRGEDALRVLIGALDVDSSNLDFVRKSMNGLVDAGFDNLSVQLLEAAVEKNPQANALRLDSLAAQEPASAAGTVAEAAGEPAPPAVVDGAAVEEVEEIDLARPLDGDGDEIDLGSLEDLPGAEGLDPAIAPPPAESSEVWPVDDSELVVEPDEQAIAQSPEVEEHSVEEQSAEAQAEAAEAESDEDFGFELDIDEVSAQLVEGEEAGDVIAKEPTEPTEPAVPTAEEVPVRATGEASKLLIESEVLSRYGMDEMAISVLDRVLQADPDNIEGLSRKARLLLRGGKTEDAVILADRVANLAEAHGAPGNWQELCVELAERGIELAEGRFVGSAAPTPAGEPVTGDVVLDLDEVLDSAGDGDEVVEADEFSIEDIVAETAALSRPKSKLRPDSADDVLAEVIQEIERDSGEGADSTAAAEAVPTEAPVVEESLEGEDAEVGAEVPAEEPLEEEVADVEWIRELERIDAEGGATAPLEPGTGEFVDLATELEAELSEEEGDFEDELLPNMREQSLEDIVEGFRQGMSETLADEDYDTHYNLGIAYREMGLVDEAIGEFQLAAKDPRYLVECCSLLAACFVDKDFPDLAIQWYVRGLASSAIEEQSRCGLLYELGTLLAATGELEAARERFLELYGINSNFRDVVAKLEELPS